MDDAAWQRCPPGSFLGGARVCTRLGAGFRRVRRSHGLRRDPVRVASRHHRCRHRPCGARRGDGRSCSGRDRHSPEPPPSRPCQRAALLQADPARQAPRAHLLRQPRRRERPGGARPPLLATPVPGRPRSPAGPLRAYRVQGRGAAPPHRWAPGQDASPAPSGRGDRFPLRPPRPQRLLHQRHRAYGAVAARQPRPLRRRHRSPDLRRHVLRSGVLHLRRLGTLDLAERRRPGQGGRRQGARHFPPASGPRG